MEFQWAGYCVDDEDCSATIGLRNTGRYYAEAGDKPIVTEAGQGQIPGEIT